MAEAIGTKWTAAGKGHSLGELTEALWSAAEKWVGSGAHELSFAAVLGAALVNVAHFARMLAHGWEPEPDAWSRAFRARTNLRLTGGDFHRHDLVRFLTGELAITEADAPPPRRRKARKR